MKQVCHTKIFNTFSELRRRHYNAIEIVCELRRYLRSAAPVQEIAHYINGEFFNHVEPRLVEEEMMLFAKLPPDDGLRLQAEQQHTNLNQLAKSCITPGEVTPALVEAFADLLEENIRFEERTLFPYLQREVSKEVAV